ncbi:MULTISPECIES: hypothetical protein [Fischerella]|nr:MULTISPECIES: hypothetical protein [Fischerella]
MINGQWSMVNGQWSMVIGQKLLFILLTLLILPHHPITPSPHLPT